MKCKACGEPMFYAPGYPGRTHDDALDQQTRIRQCKCGEKRVTVEIDADALAQLRRKAYLCDTFDMMRAPVKAKPRPKKKHVRSNGWTPEQEALMREHFPSIGTGVCKLLNKTKKSVETKASRMGIHRIYSHGGPRRQRVVKPEFAEAVSPSRVRVASVFQLGSLT